MPLLVRKLRIKGDNVTDEEERTARLEANQAALALIGTVAENHDFPSDVIDRLRAEYDERMEQLRLCAENPEDCSGEIATPQYERLQHEALRIELQTIIRLRNLRRRHTSLTARIVLHRMAVLAYSKIVSASVAKSFGRYGR